ncbi:mRNA turnover and ribosome assembly protein [Spiromyces aspiralis]|uniref:mRNA turnover and ribosome assembly protein n=1 Tax=Spiromyces aspiralis TaxID=68401 RepID=A0ACC1HZM5_9FUNG|nr:mRNA turnover and ribosome assembly protein [Spiromyces aspiralis]
MPRSRRVKLVSLTKTTGKGLEGKKELIQEIQDSVENYGYIWVFSVENSRNAYLKQVRNKMKTSRFFFGKNKVMAKALGNDPETEIRDNIHKVSAVRTKDSTRGEVGLLFTNTGPEEIKRSVYSPQFLITPTHDRALPAVPHRGRLCQPVLTMPMYNLLPPLHGAGSFFEDYNETDYARAGNPATQDVVISAGEVTRGYDNELFPNNMEPELRRLGMPTLLKKGKIVIDSDYQICRTGQILTSEQAQLLKLFWVPMAEFRVRLLCYWHNGEFHELEASEDHDNSNDNEGMNIE